MAKLLFRLNGVSDDEAERVRTALNKAEFNYYETNDGKFGLGVAGIWLHNEYDYQDARELIDQVQQEWQQEVQAEPIPTIAEKFLEKPLAFLVGIIGILLVASFSFWPFFNRISGL